MGAKLLLLLPLVASIANGASQEELRQTIAALDGALFDAYNRCDLEKFRGFLADDLEFYHDQTGLTRSREAVVEVVKNNVCGKTRRELVPEAFKVYR